MSGISKELFDKLRDRLTYPNPVYESAVKYGSGYVSRKIPRTLRTWDYKDGEIYLPRGIMMEFLSMLPSHSPPAFVDRRVFTKVNAPEKLVTTRGYQEKLIEHAKLYPGAGLIIASAAGSGKTLTGLELARREGRKTLWITHTKELAQQTMKAASDQAKVPILGLPMEEMGFIGDGKFNVGSFLTIATIQTLSRRQAQTAELKYEFGTIVIDEVHHSPAATWKTASHLFSPALTVGLTATSYRSDGLTQMLFDCIGPVVARSDKKLLIEEGVLVIPTYWVMNTGIKYTGSTFNDIVSQLVTDPRRNFLLFDKLKDIYNANKDNVALFLSGRVEHIEIMAKLCQEEGMEPIILLGKLSKLERSLAYEKLDSKRQRVLLATAKLLSEGFDYPAINHVIMGTPFKNPTALEQIVGRAQRIHPGKKDAHIIDPVDDNRMLQRQAIIRREIATGLGMDICLLT